MSICQAAHKGLRFNSLLCKSTISEEQADTKFLMVWNQRKETSNILSEKKEKEKIFLKQLPVQNSYGGLFRQNVATTPLHAAVKAQVGWALTAVLCDE